MTEQCTEWDIFNINKQLMVRMRGGGVGAQVNNAN